MADIFVTSKPRDVSKGGSRGDVFIFSHISVGSNPVHFQDRRRHLVRAKKSTYRVPRGRHVGFRQLTVTASTEKGQTRALLRVYMVVIQQFPDLMR